MVGIKGGREYWNKGKRIKKEGKRVIMSNKLLYDIPTFMYDKELHFRKAIFFM